MRGFVLLFPAALLYYEIAFRLFTRGKVLDWSTLLLIPLCCAYGGIGYLLCTATKSRRINLYLTVALLFLTALPYGVEAFLYREFGILYNFKAIFAGTGDVVTGFGSEILRLVFSFQGLLCIAVYLLPTVLFALLGSAPTQIGGRTRAMTAARMVAFYLVALAFIRTFPTLERVYDQEYTFQGSVEKFGLVSGVQLEMREALMGRDTATFQQVDIASLMAKNREAEADETETDETETDETAEPGETADPNTTADPNASPDPNAQTAAYGPNQLDLPLNEETSMTTDTFRNLDAYVSGLEPTMKNEYTGMFEGKNLIMITAEAFSKEAIDPERTPTLYRMMTKGIQFTDYYQFAAAGTTGGEYQHIFGLLPSNGLDSMKDMTSHNVLINMPSELYARGYYGVAYHNGSSTFYDREQTHNRLGFSNGFLAMGNGLEDVMGVEWDTSDVDLFEKTVPTYIDQQPFNTYYMTVSAHTPYGFDDNYWAAQHRSSVEDLPYSDLVKGYLASNMELEDAMTYLIDALEKAGIADNTVICLTPDHYPYGLANVDNKYVEELYGYEMKNVFDRDHSCWLLWCGSLEDQEPIVVAEPTYALDILPTLLNLFGIDYDSRLLPGRDVFAGTPALVYDSLYSWKTEYGYYVAEESKFYPTVDESQIPDGYVDTMKAVVRNEVNYCNSVLNNDYFTYLFWR